MRGQDEFQNQDLFVFLDYNHSTEMEQSPPLKISPSLKSVISLQSNIAVWVGDTPKTLTL
jgi:hypothetical protein